MFLSIRLLLSLFALRLTDMIKGVKWLQPSLATNGFQTYELLSKYPPLTKVLFSFVQDVQNVTKPMTYFESVFPGRLISKRLWPPRSPDLSPPRLLLWGHLKDTVYSDHPHTLQELQANIQRTVDTISTGTLQNVFANMIRHVHLCEERNDGHFQNLL
jgi:hypothetical protein